MPFSGCWWNFCLPSPPGCWVGPPLHGAVGKGAHPATQDAERDSQRRHHLGGSGRRRDGPSAPPLPEVEERGSIQVSRASAPRAWLLPPSPHLAECWDACVGEIIVTQHILQVRHSSRRFSYLCYFRFTCSPSTCNLFSHLPFSSPLSAPTTLQITA